MKKIAASIAMALLLLISMIPPAMAAGSGTTVYSNTQRVADNLNYTNYISYINGTQRQLGYMLDMTGKGDAYPIVLADDTIYGSMTISQAVAYAEEQGRNVLAAVNTDFFSMKTGVPMGIVVENGVYKSSSEEGAAVAFMADGSVYFSENPDVTITLKNNGGDADKTNSGQTVTLKNFNKYRMDTGGLYLFSAAFSTQSTRTSSPGWYVRFKILSGAPAVSGTMELEVADMVRTDEDQPIGDDYLLLTAADQCGYAETYEQFKIGDKVTLTTACADEKLAGAGWATGGGDILIKDGKLTDEAGWDKDIKTKNPRTAFGVKADGSVVCYVADGREADNSAGLTLVGLAEELLQQGCVTAVNFDGGGSSALSVRLPGMEKSTVMNNPADGSERKCAAYLLFVTDKASDGGAKNLRLQNDGAVLLAGSSLELSYFASDGGYKAVAAPADVTAQSVGGLGTVNGAIYQSGILAGIETLNISSAATGAAGKGTVHIIEGPTTLTLMGEGDTTAPAALTIWPGDSLQMVATAAYYGLPVIADQDAVQYSVTGDIGTISEDGLFTAGAVSDVTGTLDLQMGSTSVSLPVTVTGFSDTAAHWAKPYIKGLTNIGVVTGITPTTFNPDMVIQRCDFVLMLYRAAGNPDVDGTSSFTDVPAEEYYAKAVAWAEQNNIAQGDGSGKFNPKATLTREQAFTFSYRALGALTVTAPDGPLDVLQAFSDRDALSDYAATPTATLVDMGVISGAYGQLNPDSAITRGEMAKILLMIIGYGCQPA